MAINYLGGLRGELHHVKVDNGEGDSAYEPTLVILSRNGEMKGRSFHVPLNTFWKWQEPERYRGDDKLMKEDLRMFMRIKKEAIAERDRARRILKRGYSDGPIIHALSLEERTQLVRQSSFAQQKLTALNLALPFSYGTGIMMETSFELFVCLAMFEIEPCPQAAAQLLLWIQEKLEDLKNMPPAEPDKEVCVGEATIFEDGQKIGTKDMMFSETEAYLQQTGQA